MIERIAKQMTHVIKEGEIVLVRDEWRAYMAVDILEEWYQTEVDNEDGEIEIRHKRSDHYWRNVSKIKSPSGSKKYVILNRLVKSWLSFYHGNPEVERSLSDNKNTDTPERTSLSEQAVNGLRKAIDFVRKSHGNHILLKQQNQRYGVVENHTELTRIDCKNRRKLKKGKKREMN